MGWNDFSDDVAAAIEKYSTDTDGNEDLKTEGTSTSYGQNITYPPVDSYARLPNSPGATFQTEESKPGAISPQDTVVKIVQKVSQISEAIDKFGNITTLPCKVKSNVALAAASSNVNATAVVSEEEFKEEESESAFDAALSNLSVVTPNMTDIAVVIGSSVNTKEEIKAALLEAQKVDMAVSLKSKHSEPLQFNTLKTPKLEATFVYNHFQEDEGDVAKQEDQTEDLLLKNRPIHTPKYVQLKWDVIGTTEQITGAEVVARRHRALRRQVFGRNSGVFSYRSKNFSNASSKHKKRVPMFISDGINKTLVDINEREKGFENVANDKVFRNSICTVLNTQGRRSAEVDVLPVDPSDTEEQK